MEPEALLSRKFEMLRWVGPPNGSGLTFVGIYMGFIFLKSTNITLNKFRKICVCMVFILLKTIHKNLQMQ